MSYDLEVLTGGMSIEAIGSSLKHSTKKTKLRIAFCGDSITADAAGSTVWNDWGWVTWFRRYFGSAVDVQKADVFAVASQGTAHLLATQLPSVLAGDYDICITMIGTNDLGSVDITANLATFYAALDTAKIYAIAIPILPHSDGNTFSSTQVTEAEMVNQYLVDLFSNSRSGRFINVLPAITDYTTGDAASGVLRDGIHTTKQGAHLIGYAAAAGAEDLISHPYFNVSTRNQLYHETDNPRGNIAINGTMSGSGGSLVNGAVGTVASNCRLQRNSASATFTLTGSKVTNSLGFGEAQLIEPSGTGDNITFTFKNDNQTAPAGISPGDILEAEIDLECVGLVGIGYLHAKLDCGTIDYLDGGNSTANGNVPTDFVGKLCVRGIIESGEDFGVQLSGATLTGIALGGSIKINSISLRKIY